MPTLRSMTRRMRTLSLWLFALVLPYVWPAMSLAQSAPQPTARKVPPVWLGYLVIFVLLAIVLGVSMMPSKRGHQD